MFHSKLLTPQATHHPGTPFCHSISIFRQKPEYLGAKSPRHDHILPAIRLQQTACSLTYAPPPLHLMYNGCFFPGSKYHSALFRSFLPIQDDKTHHMREDQSLKVSSNLTDHILQFGPTDFSGSSISDLKLDCKLRSLQSAPQSSAGSMQFRSHQLVLL